MPNAFGAWNLLTPPPRSSAPRIAVLAGERETREALLAALEGAPGVDRKLLTGVDAEPLARETSGAPDIIVLALGPSEDVAVHLRETLAAHEAVPVLVVAPADDVQAIRAALGAGAAGYVSTADAATVLSPALFAVLHGQLVAPAALRTQYTWPVLSNREKQILAMLVLGLSNDQISRKLYVAESTVKSHLSKAYRKLGVSSRHEAAAAILQPDGLGTGVLGISANDEPAE